MAFFENYLINKIQRPDIIGKWTGENLKYKFQFNFNTNQFCNISIVNKNSGEEKFIQGKYQISFAKVPMTMTINEIRSLNHPLHTIIEFKDNRTIRVAKFSPKWRLRPVSFEYQSTIELNLESN